MTEEAFVADPRTQQAVQMNLMIMGEAAAKLLKEDPALSAREPQIAWRGIRAMRNRIIHGYFDIDLVIVWETVMTAVPELFERVKTLQMR